MVFRPTGTGQAFFSVTTLEGDVGVTTADGSVDVPIGVLDNQEVSILVDVDDTTGVVTVVTPIAQIVTTTADPVVLAAMVVAVQQTIEAVVNIVITSDADQTPAADEGDSGGTPAAQGASAEGDDDGEGEPPPPEKTETTPIVETTDRGSRRLGEG